MKVAQANALRTFRALLARAKRATWNASDWSFWNIEVRVHRRLVLRVSVEAGEATVTFAKWSAVPWQMQEHYVAKEGIERDPFVDRATKAYRAKQVAFEAYNAQTFKAKGA